MVAFVLLSVWCIFMFLTLASHGPGTLETEALAQYGDMHWRWGIAAGLAILFLAADLVARSRDLREPRLRHVTVDILALVMLTMMFVVNVLFSGHYASLHWQRDGAYMPTHRVRGGFDYPAYLVPGSTANQAWTDFQEWLDRYTWSSTVVGLEFSPDQPVRHLAQCTPDIWRAGYEEIRLHVDGGSEHILLQPWSSYGYRLLLPAEGGGLDGIRVVNIDVEDHRGQLAPGIEMTDDVVSDAYGAPDLDKILKESRRISPVQVLVPRQATLQWLDSLLSQLEGRGATDFALYFYG